MNTRHPLVRGLVAAWLGLPMGAVQLAHAQEGYQLHRDIPYGEVTDGSSW